MSFQEAKLQVGQLVHHKLFEYRGVVVDIDPVYQLSEEWYETMAKSRPPRDQPWYHVLVDNAEHMTYVAERNLEPDESSEPVKHPALEQYFTGMKDGLYVPRKPAN